jgi:hypothetical protein
MIRSARAAVVSRCATTSVARRELLGRPGRGRLGGQVQGRCRLIQQQDGGIHSAGTGKGDQLSLPG